MPGKSTTDLICSAPPAPVEHAGHLSPEAAAVLADVQAWPKPFLTPSRVGRLLGVTGTTVVAMAERGEIDFVRFGAGGRIRIPKSAVLRLLTPPDAASA